MMRDTRKQALRPGPIVGDRFGLGDWHQVFSTGENEGVPFVVVSGHAFGRLPADAWHAQAPAEPERSIAVACAVDKVQFWLKAISAGRQGQGHSEVASSRVQIRRELFPDPTKCTAALGKGDHLAGSTCLHTHGLPPPDKIPRSGSCPRTPHIGPMSPAPSIPVSENLS